MTYRPWSYINNNNNKPIQIINNRDKLSVKKIESLS